MELGLPSPSRPSPRHNSACTDLNHLRCAFTALPVKESVVHNLVSDEVQRSQHLPKVKQVIRGETRMPSKSLSVQLFLSRCPVQTKTPGVLSHCWNESS